MVDVARELLPPGFTRRCKRGFGMPFAAWMKGPLRPMFDEALSSGVVRQRGLFDYEAVGRIYDDFRNGHAAWNQTWLLCIIESWCRLVLDSSWVARPTARNAVAAREGLFEPLGDAVAGNSDNVSRHKLMSDQACRV